MNEHSLQIMCVFWKYMYFYLGNSPRQKSTTEHSQLGEDGTESFSLWHSHWHIQLLE